MGQNSIELTQKERSLIELLNQNSSLSMREIADQLSIGREEAEETTARLEDKGAIDRFTVIDPRKVGLTAPGYAMIQCEETYDRAIDESVAHVDEHPGVQSIGTVFGEYDIIIRKLSDGVHKLNNFANNALNFTTAQKTCLTTELIRWQGIDVPPDEWELDPDLDEELNTGKKSVLQALWADPTLKQDHSELARRVGLDLDEVTGAISELEKRNVILGYSVKPTLDMLGWGRAYLGISTLPDLPPTNDEEEENYQYVIENLLKENRREEVMKDHLHVPFVSSGLGMTAADVFVEVVFESMTHLDALSDEIRETDGVRTTRTYIEANSYYSEYSLPIE